MRISPQKLPVVYDATGVGATTGSASSLSWSHTAAPGTAIILGASLGQVSGITATCNGVSMTQLAQVNNGNNATYGQAVIFGLLGAGTGSAATVQLSWSGSTQCAADSASYLNVGGFDVSVTNYGISTALSLSVNSAPGQMVAQIFTTFGSPVRGITGYNQTTRYSGTATNLALLMGDAPGPTVSFTGSAAAGTYENWAAAAVNLKTS